MNSKHSRPADDWDGFAEHRTVGTQVAQVPPGEPVTREYLDEALTKNRHATREFVGNKFSELEGLIRAGFPHGDPVAHCKVHDGYIQEAAERRAFWKSVVEKIATGAIYTAVIAVATAVWTWIKSEAHK